MTPTVQDVVVAAGDGRYRCPPTFGQDVRVFQGRSYSDQRMIEWTMRTDCADSAKADEQNVFLCCCWNNYVRHGFGSAVGYVVLMREGVSRR
jgi:hypothetical protein